MKFLRRADDRILTEWNLHGTSIFVNIRWLYILMKGEITSLFTSTIRDNIDSSPGLCCETLAFWGSSGIILQGHRDILPSRCWAIREGAAPVSHMECLARAEGLLTDTLNSLSLISIHLSSNLATQRRKHHSHFL